MRKELKEAMEENLRKLGEIKGIPLIQGGKKVKKLCTSTQSMATVKMNAQTMEEEMFEASSSKVQYMGKVMRGVISGAVFPVKGEKGCKRWCLQGGKVVCKELIKVEKQLVWADCMEYEELVRETGETDDITIPVDEKGLVKEVAWRDIFRSHKKDLNNN